MYTYIHTHTHRIHARLLHGDHGRHHFGLDARCGPSHLRGYLSLCLCLLSVHLAPADMLEARALVAFRRSTCPSAPPCPENEIRLCATARYDTIVSLQGAWWLTVVGPPSPPGVRRSGLPSPLESHVGPNEIRSYANPE